MTPSQKQSVATVKRVLRKIGLEVPVVLTSAAKKTGAERGRAVGLEKDVPMYGAPMMRCAEGIGNAVL